MKLLWNASLKNAHKLWPECSLGSSEMILNKKLMQHSGYSGSVKATSKQARH